MSLAGGGDPAPFEEWHGEVGCLLLHGFPGSPAEVRELGSYLGERGVSVIAPRLPGLGETPEALRGVHWEDWLRAAAADARRLREHGRWVFAVGLSMGGALALYLSAEIPLDGVVAICPAVWLRNRAAPLTPVLQHVLRWVEPGVDPVDADPEAARRHRYYTRFPAESAAQIYKLTRALWQAAPHILSPVLVLQSHGDEALRPEGAKALVKRISSEKKEFTWLEHCGHNALIEPGREEVFQKVSEFIDRVAGR